MEIRPSQTFRGGVLQNDMGQPSEMATKENLSRLIRLIFPSCEEAQCDRLPAQPHTSLYSGLASGKALSIPVLPKLLPARVGPNALTAPFQMKLLQNF